MDFRRPPFYVSAYFAVLAIIAALLLAPSRVLFVFRNSTKRILSRIASSRGHLISNETGLIESPVYFLSHGGPNIIYDEAHPVYATLQEIGREITQKVKPKAIVVFSAHWQGQLNVIEVNTAEETDLIYDFYGFPAKYYKEKFPHRGSKEVAEKVIELLSHAGIETKATNRGLDHGVWACFKVAFNPTANPLIDIPIIQVSLYGSEDPHQHYALGQALTTIRSQGILLITSGMAVHNLHDLRFDAPFPSVLPYTKTFDEALREAVESSPAGSRESKMAALLKRDDARGAHPTFEHLLPLFVGAGSAGEDQGRRIWTFLEGSLSWAMFRFGEVPERS